MNDTPDPAAVLRGALYRSLAVAAIGIIMLIGKKYTILGWINIGAALLILVFQYLLPMQRQRANRNSRPDTDT